MLLNAAAVFFGGAIGSLFRFLIAEFLPMKKFGIPLTIIVVNILGCFIMGMADAFFESRTAATQYRYFITVGLLGGFTTFSAFSLDFANLIKNGQMISGAIYVLISVVFALIGFWLGYSLIKALR